MNYLFILNDPPYGTERSYNGLRLATSLAKSEGTILSVFLIGDAASCALKEQVTPSGYYKELIQHGAEAKLCTTCITRCGICQGQTIAEAPLGEMTDLVAWTDWADKAVMV